MIRQPLFSTTATASHFYFIQWHTETDLDSVLYWVHFNLDLVKITLAGPNLQMVFVGGLPMKCGLNICCSPTLWIFGQEHPCGSKSSIVLGVEYLWLTTLLEYIGLPMDGISGLPPTLFSLLCKRWEMECMPACLFNFKLN